MDEYLEKLFADAFKRELEQEENVLRSLPFTAAAAAIVVAVIRELADDLPLWNGTALGLCLHALLVLTGLSLCYTGWFVFQALRRRPFRYPRGEAEIRNIANRLSGYHRQAGLAAEEAEAAALVDLRREMIDQYAVCAENNRRQNEARQAARTDAFHGLMTAFLFAVLLVGTTYVTGLFAGAEADGITDRREVYSKPDQGVACVGQARCRPDKTGKAGSDSVGKAASETPSDSDQGIVGPGATQNDRGG